MARERRQREKAREAEKRKRQVLASLEPLPTTISAEEALAGMRTTHMSGVDALIAAAGEAEGGGGSEAAEEAGAGPSSSAPAPGGGADGDGASQAGEGPKIEPEDIPALAHAFGVLRAFSWQLKLGAFTFSDFCCAMAQKRHTPLLDEVHVSVLLALIADESVDVRATWPYDISLLDNLSWPTYLWYYLAAFATGDHRRRYVVEHTLPEDEEVPVPGRCLPLSLDPSLRRAAAAAARRKAKAKQADTTPPGEQLSREERARRRAIEAATEAEERAAAEAIAAVAAASTEATPAAAPEAAAPAPAAVKSEAPAPAVPEAVITAPAAVKTEVPASAVSEAAAAAPAAVKNEAPAAEVQEAAPMEVDPAPAPAPAPEPPVVEQRVSDMSVAFARAASDVKPGQCPWRWERPAGPDKHRRFVEYSALSLADKANILAKLCDELLEMRSIREEMERREVLQGEWGTESHWLRDHEVEVVGEGDGDHNYDICVLCGGGGNLVCCDGCPAAFHMKCCGLSHWDLRGEDWLCSECTLHGRGSGKAWRGPRLAPLVGRAAGGLTAWRAPGALFLTTGSQGTGKEPPMLAFTDAAEPLASQALGIPPVGKEWLLLAHYENAPKRGLPKLPACDLKLLSRGAMTSAESGPLSLEGAESYTNMYRSAWAYVNHTLNKGQRVRHGRGKFLVSKFQWPTKIAGATGRAGAVVGQLLKPGQPMQRLMLYVCNAATELCGLLGGRWEAHVYKEAFTRRVRAATCLHDIKDALAELEAAIPEKVKTRWWRLAEQDVGMGKGTLRTGLATITGTGKPREVMLPAHLLKDLPDLRRVPGTAAAPTTTSVGGTNVAVQGGGAGNGSAAVLVERQGAVQAAAEGDETEGEIFKSFLPVGTRATVGAVGEGAPVIAATAAIGPSRRLAPPKWGNETFHAERIREMRRDLCEYLRSLTPQDVTTLAREMCRDFLVLLGVTKPKWGKDAMHQQVGFIVSTALRGGDPVAAAADLYPNAHDPESPMNDLNRVRFMRTDRQVASARSGRVRRESTALASPSSRSASKGKSKRGAHSNKWLDSSSIMTDSSRKSRRDRASTGALAAAIALEADLDDLEGTGSAAGETGRVKHESIVPHGPIVVSIDGSTIVSGGRVRDELPPPEEELEEDAAREALVQSRRMVAYWWAGGWHDRQGDFAQCLPATVARRAARQGGVRKIPGVIYSKTKGARRTMQQAWRAQLEAARTWAQLASVVRRFDAAIRWEEVRVPAGEHGKCPLADKRPSPSAYGGFEYTTTVLRDMPNNVRVEMTMWVHEEQIPLWMLRVYEERARALIASADSGERALLEEADITPGLEGASVEIRTQEDDWLLAQVVKVGEDRSLMLQFHKNGTQELVSAVDVKALIAGTALTFRKGRSARDMRNRIGQRDAKIREHRRLAAELLEKQKIASAKRVVLPAIPEIVPCSELHRLLADIVGHEAAEGARQEQSRGRLALQILEAGGGAPLNALVKRRCIEAGAPLRPEYSLEVLAQRKLEIQQAVDLALRKKRRVPTFTDEGVEIGGRMELDDDDGELLDFGDLDTESAPPTKKRKLKKENPPAPPKPPPVPIDPDEFTDAKGKKMRDILTELRRLEDPDEPGRLIFKLFERLPTSKQLPVYYKVIARPIDYHSIIAGIRGGGYRRVSELVVDVETMLGNAMIFNAEDSPLFSDAITLRDLFRARLAAVFPHVDAASCLGKACELWIDPPKAIRDASRSWIEPEPLPERTPTKSSSKSKKRKESVGGGGGTGGGGGGAGGSAGGGGGDAGGGGGDAGSGGGDAGRGGTPGGGGTADGGGGGTPGGATPGGGSGGGGSGSAAKRIRTSAKKPPKPKEPVPSLEIPPKQVEVPTVSALCTEIVAALRHTMDGERNVSELFYKLPTKREFPAYYKVIPQPIDISCIEWAIKKEKYPSLENLAVDVKLMCGNAQFFNQEGSMLHVDAGTLRARFDQLYVAAAQRLKDAEAAAAKMPTSGEVLRQQLEPLGGSARGARVEVLWEDDNAWYPAEIASARPGRGQWDIVYTEDDHQETLKVADKECPWVRLVQMDGLRAVLGIRGSAVSAKLEVQYEDGEWYAAEVASDTKKGLEVRYEVDETTELLGMEDLPRVRLIKAPERKDTRSRGPPPSELPPGAKTVHDLVKTWGKARLTGHKVEVYDQSIDKWQKASVVDIEGSNQKVALCVKYEDGSASKLSAQDAACPKVRVDPQTRAQLAALKAEQTKDRKKIKAGGGILFGVQQKK